MLLLTLGLPPPHPLRMMLFPPGPGPSQLAFPLGLVMQSADGCLRDLSLQIHWIKHFGWHRFLQKSQMLLLIYYFCDFTSNENEYSPKCCLTSKSLLCITAPHRCHKNQDLLKKILSVLLVFEKLLL